MTTIQKIAKYGWRRQKPDPRDRSYNQEEKILHSWHLPKKVDPLTAGIPAYDQMQLGSCVGNGVARVLQYAQSKQGEGSVVPSRLFVYGGARKIEGTFSSDSGAEIRDGIKTVVHQGAPPETVWPYSDANPGPFNTEPPQNVYDAAVSHEALQYRTITNGSGAPFRTALANGLPIVFGFSVPASFEDGSWYPGTQVLPLPSATTQYIGGHCVVVDGYDFSCVDFPEPFWWCANSWGESWGTPPSNGPAKGGWFRMHYRYFDNVIATDHWVIDKVK